MKRFLPLLLVLAILLPKTGYSGMTNLDALTLTENLTFQSNMLANGGADGVLTLASSSTVITAAMLSYSTILKYVGGGGGLDSLGSTLPNGKKRQTITFTIAGLQPGGTWVLTPTTKTGFRSITFDTKGDSVTLLYVNDTVGWTIFAKDGVSISQD